MTQTPSGKHLHCRACGSCCYDHTVLVTFRDLREIHQAYPHLRLEDLVVLYDAMTEYADHTILERFHPALLVFELSPTASNPTETTPRSGGSTWKAYLGLRFAKLPGGQTVCPQLDRAKGRCTIHCHKPLVCRTYPHVLDDACQVQRLEKVRCNPPWGDPADWLPEERERVRQVVAEAYRAHDQFITEVQEWNTMYAGKTVADFFAFALRPPKEKENKMNRRVDLP